MTTADSRNPVDGAVEDVGTAESVRAERLAALRASAVMHRVEAADGMWAWFAELQAPSRRPALSWLFSQGGVGEAPDGDCEGIVLELHGTPWLVGLDLAVRLGRRLGGMGWTGKTFDAARGDGYNRLAATTLPVTWVVLPTYRFRRVGGELVGFPFHHRVEPSPRPPQQDVRAITYDAPEHRNPLVLPRTRDEIVELVPGVYLGRALLRGRDSWQVVGYFGLRTPDSRGC